MEDNVMGTVFHVYDPYIKNKVYLLDEWGSAKDGKVSKWVQTLTIKGVGDRKGKCVPI